MLASISRCSRVREATRLEHWVMIGVNSGFIRGSFFAMMLGGARGTTQRDDQMLSNPRIAENAMSKGPVASCIRAFLSALGANATSFANGIGGE